ncbi:paired amphipathic helix protein Sin3b-like [Triticum urartu]|uniref:paired amphipathic helix protein Sin3b-like n=1 Tax=Triticum urartu TaxID=4572 RepID=UPI002043F384|nr:paired amphipathic helix protein Sin3b-like [Triticum urartu]
MAPADSHGEFLELEDALRYMKMVKNRHPATYNEFLNVMAHYKRGRIGVAEVASRVAALLRDSPDLIVGFNAFLPKGHRIRLSDEQLAARFMREVSLDDHDDDKIHDGCN